MTNILVPTLGESVTEATVATWFKRPGESVSVDEMLCELETDKVTVEVPSPVAGILKEISSDEGATVGLNAVLAIVDEHNPNDTKNNTAANSQKNPPSKNSNALSERKEKTKDIIHAPSARKIMEDLNLNPSEVTGSGRDGRIMKEDVINQVNMELNKQILPDEKGGLQRNSSVREERVKMSRLRLTIADRLKQAQNTAAMLTTYNEVDMSSIIKIRTKYKSSFEKKR